MIALITTVAISACGKASGGGDSSAAHQHASLMLDFTPNAIHSGIYTALAEGSMKRAGVDLDVEIPGASTDAISELIDGRVTFASLDIHDLAIADEHHAHLVGVMALVQRPLAAVIAQPRYADPRDLDGTTVGVTGDPSDLAVLRSIVDGAGGRFRSIRTLTIGYDAVSDLIAGRVAAATSFWNDEGVELNQEKPGYHIFRVENYGAPAYPELVLTTTRAEIRRDPGLVRAVVGALVHGYQRVISHPATGARALESQVSGLVPAQVSEQLKGEIPAFTPAGGGPVGALEPSLLRAWARWELKFGIVKRLPDVATMFTQAFLPRR